MSHFCHKNLYDFSLNCGQKVGGGLGKKENPKLREIAWDWYLVETAGIEPASENRP